MKRNQDSPLPVSPCPSDGSSLAAPAASILLELPPGANINTSRAYPWGVHRAPSRSIRLLQGSPALWRGPSGDPSLTRGSSRE